MAEQAWHELDVADIPSWPRGAQLILLAILLLTILTLAYWFWLAPLHNNITQQTIQLEQKQTSVARLAERYQQLGGNTAAPSTAFTATSFKPLTTPLTASELFAELAIQPSQYGLTLSQIRPASRQRSSRSNTANQSTIQLTFSGEFSSMQAFIGGLLAEHQAANMIIQSLQINRNASAGNPDSNDNDSPELQATMQLSAEVTPP